MKKLFVTVATTVLVLLPTAAPAASRLPDPAARAWALRISLPGQPEALVWADVSSVGGRTARSTGRPVVIGGTTYPGPVVATPSEPDAATSLQDYTDQTGSLTAQWAFAEAHADEVSSTSRAGWETMSGNGAALANEYFTFEQQEQLLGQWTDLNAAIFGPLNESVAQVGALLAPAGVSVPALEPISAAGLVNAMNAQEVASSSSASMTPGFASARAETTMRHLQLFGGFIDAEAIAARALSESADGTDTREARATIGRLRIAGIEVVGDQDGLRVTGNDVVSRTVIQPALDVLMNGLVTAGITIRVADPRADGIRRDAAALEVELDSAQGSVLISIAYAEAAAPTVVPLGDGSPDTVGPAPQASVLPDGPSVQAPPGAVRANETRPPVTVAPAEVGAGPWIRRMPAAVARALRTAYLLLVVTAIGAAFTVPALLARRKTKPARIEIVTRSILKEEAS